MGDNFDELDPQAREHVQALAARMNELYGHLDGRLAEDFDALSGKIVDYELSECKALLGDWLKAGGLPFSKLTAADAASLYHFAIGNFRFDDEVEHLGPRYCLELAWLGSHFVETLDDDLTIEIPSTGRRVSLWDISLADLRSAVRELPLPTPSASKEPFSWPGSTASARRWSTLSRADAGLALPN